MTTPTAGRPLYSSRLAVAPEPRRLPFDAAVEAILYPLLAFAPLAFGTTQAWSREVWLIGVGAVAVTAAAKHVALAWRGERSAYRWSWAFVPIVLFLTLCGLQLVPLPAGVMRAVSPGTSRLRAELLADLPAELARRAPVTFYPWATRQQAILVAAVAVLFAVVLDVFRDEARIRRLLAVVATVGLATAGLAAYQNLSGTDAIYFGVQQQHRNAGPFANYSHFSQSVNLAVGAALALLLVRAAELSSFYRSPAEWWSGLRGLDNWPVWAWAGLCVLGPITVLLSMSRMGAISMFAAAAVTGGMLAWRGRAATATTAAAGVGRGWLLVGLTTVVFAVLLGVGFDRVVDRISTAKDPTTTGGRQQMLRDIGRIVRQFPLLGTGLGTHEVVYAQFDHRDLAQRASHAENEYAQVTEETGMVGAALAAAFLATVVVSYARATRRPVEPLDYAAFGLGFGLVAILIHSASDFGQHLPSNAMVTAIFAALLAVLAGRNRETDGSVPTPGRRRLASLAGHGLLAAGVVAAAVAVGLWADRARAAESLSTAGRWRAHDLAARNWAGTDDEYLALLRPAAAAVETDPGNVEYRYDLGVYRWHTLARAVDPATGQTQLPIEAVPIAGRIVEDLQAIRPVCPTYGPPLTLAGQLDAVVLNRPDAGRREAELGYRLARNDPAACLSAGLVFLGAHRWDDAKVAFGRYRLLGGWVGDFADACLRARQPGIVYDLVRGNRGDLLYLASRMPVRRPGWQVWTDLCRSDAAKLLAVEANRPDASAEALAEQAAVDRAAGRLADATDRYRRAVSLRVTNTGWRLELARCLNDAGRPADAVRELRICLREQPKSAAVRALLADCEAQVRRGPTSAP